MTTQASSTLYVRLPGLLASAAARGGFPDAGQTPIAVTEGKSVRDACALALGQGVQVGQSSLRARRMCQMLLIIPLEQVDALTFTYRLYDILAQLSPTVEPAGPDAAFMVVEPAEAALVLKELCGAFLELQPLLAVGSSKLVARTLAEAGVARFDLAPSRFLWPEDAAITGKLDRLGLPCVGTVAHIGEAALRYQFGPKIGSLLHRRALGFDSDPVCPVWPLPTVESFRRFDLDPLEDAACLDAHLIALAKQTAWDLVRLRRYGRVVTLAVETERGKSERQWRPPWPIQSPAETLSAARRLLTLQSPRAPVTSLRLVVSELELPQAQSLSLFDPVGVENRRRLEAAKRFVVARYGPKAMTTLSKVPVALRDRRRELAREAIQT